MKAVFCFGKWNRIPEWGVPVIETSVFGQMAFSHYSSKIASGLVETLTDRQKKYNYEGFWGWIKKYRNWDLCLILRPTGDLKTRFKIGYCDENGVCKIAPAQREVGEGPFAMMVGPKNCYFFIIGEREVSLGRNGYISKKSKQAKEGEYKKMKII